MPYKDKAKEAARSRRRYAKDPKRHRRICQRWLENNSERWKAYQREYRSVNRERLRAYGRRWTADNKRAVVSHYGGRCRCCGEDEINFLTVDHIEGYKKSSGEPRSGTKLYRWLITNGFPQGFQILCWNCNAAKGLFGYCPHIGPAT